MKPLVSVLIPAYNHELYIGTAIESVLNQTFGDFELLISDDYSTDNTVRVINGFSDDRIKTFFFDKNSGTVNSLNTLINAAEGEYIAVLGSDDIWAPDKLEKQLEVMKNMPDIAACFTLAEVIDGEGNIIQKSDTFPLDIFNYENAARAKMLCDLFLTGNHFCHSSVMIRTSVHKEIGVYKLQYRQLHDFDMWLRVLLYYPVWIIQDKLVNYRVESGNNNMSRNQRENNIRLFNEAKYIFSDMFNNISDTDFINGFNELFSDKNASDSISLKCEKFFVLLNNYIWGYDCKSLSVDYLFDNISDPDFCECLEKKYKFTLNDFYKVTGIYTADCPADFFEEFRNIKEKNTILEMELAQARNDIQLITNSRSWRLISSFGKIKRILGGKQFGRK